MPVPRPRFRIRLCSLQKVVRIRRRWLKEVAATTLIAEGIAKAELDIAFVDDATIHRVNRESLQHDYPTDVISFLYDSRSVPRREDEPAAAIHPNISGAAMQPSQPMEPGRSIEGELVISAETAQREAAEQGADTHLELALYVVHGLLHLCGYDDLDDSARMTMRAREQAILQIFGLTPHYGDQ